MIPTRIPDDINIELLLSYFPEGQCKVTFCGLHKRNVYNDLIELKDEPNEKVDPLEALDEEEIKTDSQAEAENELEKPWYLNVGRTSLYDSLPEMMFHPIDRFGQTTNEDDAKSFDEEYKAQEKEKENARQLFAPVDLMLLNLRMMVRERLRVYAETDKVMIDILGDQITEEQKSNKFVAQAISFLPYCKSIRGNKTYLTLMLRKIFMEEGLSVRLKKEIQSFTDEDPRYKERLDNDLDGLYLGNTFDEPITVFEIRFWPEEQCDEHFLQFVKEVEIFRSFLQDYFMSVEEILRFDITCDSDPVCLSDDNNFYYMNYNMNI